ncbi:uncharacterized protein LOC127143829 [Cucumis melo]|uniref:Uncharacterized protein LOC127143829 n=1 Tax=Cucumis melo TaxID=3656 RepID=A0ABM3KB36_CUCME|nr:uncharacterized protein LOC127143829 [Cucumis melo]
MTKAIANRLKSTLPITISPIQLAFVKGRQITDVILMANEAVDFWLTSKTKGYILKLDIKKAFDKVRWDFIDYMLKVKNYPLKWRSWIKAYDILVFIEDDNRVIKSLQKAIFLSEAASGLTINRSKSSITLVNIPTNKSAEVANLWNFPTRSFPIEYLGVPLGGKPNSKGFWINIVDEIQKKLNGWKYS